MQSHDLRRLFFALILLAGLSAACSLPILAVQPTATSQTQPAQATLEAMMTQAAATQPVVVTAIPTATTAPPATQVPTQPVWPTATRPVLPSATYQPVCDLAGFVDDVSVPDGTAITAGTQFIKTWRLKNQGACTWTQDYAVVFSSGEGMGAAAAVKIGVSVLPGQTVDV